MRDHKTAAGALASPNMATYLQVSSDIAERVAAGALAIGDELPSVRKAARLYETTTTTVARAYRCLADAGVIDVSDRRGSTVAADGSVAARRLLGAAGWASVAGRAGGAGPAGGPGVLRLAGSDDPGLDIAARSAGAGHVVTVGPRGSFHGLTGIWRGTADAAAIHLRHRSGTQNSPFARTLLRGRRPRSSTPGGASRGCSRRKAIPPG